MQTKSLTTALTAMLLISAVPMMASSKGSCSAGAYVDTAAKVGGLAALTYFTGKGAHCLYKYAWKKAPTTQAQLDKLNADVNCPKGALRTELAGLAGNQKLVMGTLFGTDGAALAQHQKSTRLGMYGVAANAEKAGAEFSDAYSSAVKAKEEADAKAKADKDAADAKAADEKAAKEKAAAAAAGK